MEKLIGREIEKSILQEALDSHAPELMALFGRRRVGKTFLVRQHYAGYLAFEFTGTREAKLSQQLRNFTKALGKAAGNGFCLLRFRRQRNSWKLSMLTWNDIIFSRYIWSWAASRII